ncbi:MAG: hypothetical protein JXJ19_02940 [Elusimicrobia bacterium]|nr:hypothetical protein [Elusimicrobiota bacterium]
MKDLKESKPDLFLVFMIAFAIAGSGGFSAWAVSIAAAVFLFFAWLGGIPGWKTAVTADRIGNSLYGVSTLLRAVIYALFVISVYLLYRRVAGVLAYPFHADYSEGFLLNEANLLARGQNIYKDINHAPYYIGNYTFFYQLLYGLILRICGHPSFLPGRLISVASTVGIAVLIFDIVKRRTGRVFAAVFSCVSFLASWYVYENIAYVTIGVMSIFLGVLGLYWVDRFRDTRAVYFGAVILLAALYTKQSWIAGTFAALIFLFFYDRKIFMRFSGIMMLLGGIVFLSVNMATAGEFYRHIFTYTVKREFSLIKAVGWMGDFGLHYYAISFLAAYYLVKSLSGRNYSAYVFYLLAAAFVAFMVGAKGAYVNYLWDLVIASCIASGIALGWLLGQDNQKTGFLVNLVILLQFANLVHIKYDSKPGYRLKMAYESRVAEPEKKDIPVYEELYGFIKNTAGRVLIKGSYALVALAGKQIEYHFYLDSIASWDKRGILEDISGGRYEIAMYKHKKSFPEDIRKEIERNFKEEGKAGKYRVFRYVGVNG